MSNRSDIRPRRRVERIIWEFNGATALAKMLDLHPSTVWRWQGNDQIPSRWQGRLLAEAETRGVKLTADDLVRR